MRFDQINPNSLAKAPDREILSLHHRCHELAATYIRRDDAENPKFRNIIVKHKLIAEEMIRRGIRFRVIDDLDKLSLPDIEPLMERFTSLIPSKLGEITKKELAKLHNQLHSVWAVVHAGAPSVAQQEQLWNFHRLVVKALMDRGVEVPQGWDSLDENLGHGTQASISGPTLPSGLEQGDWVFLQDVLPYVPAELVVFEQAVLIDTTKKLMWLTDAGGRQLIKVMFFRILRQFPREDWAGYKTVGLDELHAIDVVYDLTLEKLSPMWTIQLSLQFADLCLVKPYLYFVGGIATQQSSRNDIDILLRGGLERGMEEKIFKSFVQAFPEKYHSRFSQVEDNGLGPFTSYIGAMSLNLKKNSNSKDVEQLLTPRDSEPQED